jgi:hypothetical protein
MVPVRQTKTCTQRYHDGTGATPVALCACSTFAIGVCADCGEPVCGDNDCSWLRDRRRLCRKHTIEFDNSANEAAAAQKAEVAAAHARALQGWEQDSLATLSSLHEFDRLLRVMRLATTPPKPGRIHYSDMLPFKVRTDLVRLLLKTDCDEATGVPDFDEEALCQWFAQRCQAPTETVRPYVQFVQRGKLSKAKQLKPEGAWRLEHGSFRRGGYDTYLQAAISSDGSRLYGRGGDLSLSLPLEPGSRAKRKRDGRIVLQHVWVETADPLNPWALAQMADLLQLPLLPEPPIPLPERPVM